MKNLKIYILFLLLAVSTSCENFLDNKNPNFPDTTTPNNLLPSIISYAIGEAYAFAGISASIGASFFSQQLASRSVTANNIDRFYMGTAQGTVWQRSYFHAGGNIPNLIKIAEQEQSWHYVGAAKVMKAIVFGNLTDLYGEAPMSEAFQGGANFTPKYDNQEQIYTEIFKLLDDALIDFGKTSTRSLATGDFMFNGDVNKWKKLANAMKARYLNHLSNKGTYSPDKILEAVAQSMTSNADDAQVTYTTLNTDTSSPRSRARGNLGGLTVSQNFINHLDGTYSKLNTGTAVVDPRLPLMLFPTPNGTGADVGKYLGVTNGSPARLCATCYGDLHLGWYGADKGPTIYLSYAELKFIEAEAAFKKGDKARALSAYTEGIRAHMIKMSVSAANIATFLTSAAVAKSATELTLKNIMEQKYIALFLNPEVWVDLRRYEYSADVYTNFTYPEQATTDFKGLWPNRLYHDQTEVLYNSGEIQKLGGFAFDYPTKKMWWQMP